MQKYKSLSVYDALALKLIYFLHSGPDDLFVCVYVESPVEENEWQQLQIILKPIPAKSIMASVL